VWRALTELEHLAAWFPTDIEGERAPGAELRFVFRNGEGPTIAGKMITFLNTFDDLGKAARDAAGWHACLNVLIYHLNAEEAPWTAAERWQDVHAAYVERFGPEASTIGPPASPTAP
jgi:hypothetical protein